jgi:hypothetical protein
MTDDLLDRVLADAAAVRDAQVASLRLGDAEAELLREIMATDPTEIDIGGGLAPRKDARRRHRTGSRTALGAVAAAAVVVAAVLVAGGGGDDPEDQSPDVAAQAPPEVPRLLADVVPEGYELESTEDGPHEGQEGVDRELLEQIRIAHRWFLYGDADAEDPFESSDLLITASSYSPAVFDDTFRMGPGERVEVRGHEGLSCPPDSCHGATTVSWTEDRGFDISLASRSINQSQLLAIAEGLEVGDGRIELGFLPSDLPGPLDELSRPGGQTPDPDAVFHAANYSQPSRTPSRPGVVDDRPSLRISATEGDAFTLLSEVVQHESHRRIEVRGHDGWLMSSPAQPPVTLPGGGYTYWPASIALSWEEQPGVIVSVVAAGSPRLTAEDLLRIAESLRPATDEEWESALLTDEPIDAAEVESYVPDAAVAFVTADQLGGAAYLTSDGRVCGYVVDRVGKTEDTCGPAEQRVHELRDRSGDVRFLFGTMPDGAADVAASNQYSGDNALSAFHDVAPEAGPRLYLLSLDVMVPETITFRDRNGEPVETLPYP